MGRLPAPALALLLGALASCATADDPRVEKPDAAKGETYWTNLSATYRGQNSAEGDEAVIQAGLLMAGEVCDSQLLDSSKVCSRPAAAGDQHEIRCRMQCRAPEAKPGAPSAAPKPGPTLVRATLFVGGHSVALQLDRLP